MVKSGSGSSVRLSACASSPKHSNTKLVDRLPTTGEPVGLGQASLDLFDRFDTDAATNVRFYDVDKTELGFDIDGSVLGFSAKYNSTDADLSSASWNSPAGSPLS